MGRFNSRSGGGRGKGRSGNSKSQTKRETKPKTLNDYVFKSNQSGEYEATLKYLLNHVRQKFVHGNDIATALEDRKEFNFAKITPTLETSKATDAA